MFLPRFNGDTRYYHIGESVGRRLTQHARRSPQFLSRRGRDSPTRPLSIKITLKCPGPRLKRQTICTGSFFTHNFTIISIGAMNKPNCYPKKKMIYYCKTQAVGRPVVDIDFWSNRPSIIINNNVTRVVHAFPFIQVSNNIAYYRIAFVLESLMNKRKLIIPTILRFEYLHACTKPSY